MVITLFMISSVFAKKTYFSTTVDKKTKSQLQAYCDFPKGVNQGSKYCRHDKSSILRVSKRYKREKSKWLNAIKSLVRIIPKNNYLRKEIINKILSDKEGKKGELNKLFKKYQVPFENKKNIWSAFKNARSKRKISKVWQAHCEMVAVNNLDEYCPKIDLEKLAIMAEKTTYYPYVKKDDRYCQTLLDEISSEADIYKKIKKKKILGDKCVNWCANFTDEEKKFHCESAIEENESPKKIHRCDAWWLSKTKDKRNLTEVDALKACSVRTQSNYRPLSSFESEYKNLTGVMARISEQEIRSEKNRSFAARIVSGAQNPFDASWRSYPMLLRIEALGGFLESACELNGSPVEAPDNCGAYAKGINSYKCSQRQKRKLSDERKNGLIQKANQLVTLFDKKKILKKEYDKKISRCLLKHKVRGTGSSNVPGVTGIDPSASTYSKFRCQEEYQDLGAQIKYFESVIKYISKKEPVLFSYADSSKSIFQQDKNFHKRLKKLSRSSVNSFEPTFKGFKKEAIKKISKSMDDICDPNKVDTKDLIQMKSLTDSVKKRFPAFSDIDKCLGKPDPTDVGGLFGVGTTLLCLAGSIGPQFFVVGGLCAGLFLGDSIVTAGEQEDLLAFLRDSAQAGDRVSTSADIDRVRQNLETAKFDVMMGILLLPLDFIGGKQALSALRKGLGRIKGVRQKAFAVKQINQRIKQIEQISDPRVQEQEALKLVKELEGGSTGLAKFSFNKANPKFKNYNQDWIDFMNRSCR
ncbi:MAG: hypothetical protein CME61_07095 [Halobacteriovoraceae bacterium]|nr:hypothetical protein [Halobacteriovoraceae bacterium]